MVEFNTWSRVVNGSIKESILDHVYIKDVTSISNLGSTTLEVGDHKLVTFNISSTAPTAKTVFKRNWTKYNKENLINELLSCDFSLEMDDV